VAVEVSGSYKELTRKWKDTSPIGINFISVAN